MPGPVHMLYPHRHSVASDQTTARSVARPAASHPRRRATIRSAVLRRCWHLALWLGQALVVSTVISVIMIGWILLEGGAR